MSSVMSTECRSIVSDFFFFVVVVFVVVLVVVVIRTNTMEERKRYVYESETTTATFFVLPISSYIHPSIYNNKQEELPTDWFFLSSPRWKNARRKKTTEIYLFFFVTDFSAEKKTSILSGVFFRRHLSTSANRRRVRSEIDIDQQQQSKRKGIRGDQWTFSMALSLSSRALMSSHFFTHASKMTINEFPFSIGVVCFSRLVSTCSFYSLTNQSIPSSFSYWRTPSVFVCCLHCRQCSHTCSCQRRTEKKQCFSFVSVDFIRRLDHEWWINVSQHFSHRRVHALNVSSAQNTSQSSADRFEIEEIRWTSPSKCDAATSVVSVTSSLRPSRHLLSFVDICHWRHSMIPCWEVRKVQRWTPALRRRVYEWNSRKPFSTETPIIAMRNIPSKQCLFCSLIVSKRNLRSSSTSDLLARPAKRCKKSSSNDNSSHIM